MVEGEKIKLDLFADDLIKFLELLKLGECSGLKINHGKSEIMSLGDFAHSSLKHGLFKSIKIKQMLKFWKFIHI